MNQRWLIIDNHWLSYCSRHIWKNRIHQICPKNIKTNENIIQHFWKLRIDGLFYKTALTLWCITTAYKDNDHLNAILFGTVSLSAMIHSIKFNLSWEPFLAMQFPLVNMTWKRYPPKIPFCQKMFELIAHFCLFFGQIVFCLTHFLMRKRHFWTLWLSFFFKY